MNYIDEKFADIQMLRYELTGFEQLTPQQKVYIYYLSQAALAGRDITFDQFLALSVYLAQIERTLDTNEHYFAVPAHRQAFADTLNRIAQGLFARYPYRYFD